MQEIHEVLGWTAAQCDHSSVQLNGRLNVKFASVPERVCFTLLSLWCWWFYFKAVLRVCWNALGVRFIFSWSQSKVRWEEIWHPNSRISSLKTAVPHPQEQHLQVTLIDSGTMWMSTLQSSQISAIRGESISRLNVFILYRFPFRKANSPLSVTRCIKSHCWRRHYLRRESKRDSILVLPSRMVQFIPPLCFKNEHSHMPCALLLTRLRFFPLLGELSVTSGTKINSRID